MDRVHRKGSSRGIVPESDDAESSPTQEPAVTTAAASGRTSSVELSVKAGRVTSRKERLDRLLTKLAPVEDAEDRMPPSRVGLAIMVVSVLGMALLCFRLRHFFTDDAWISVRYAENLADGHGFVWNPGGVPAEGFSNPLLVYGEALAHWVGWSSISFARTLGVASAVGCICLVYLGGRQVVGEIAARSATDLTGLCRPMALWAVGGLETAVMALVITAATLELARHREGRPWMAAALLGLLPWLRPEGLAVALAVAVFWALPGLLRTSTRRRALIGLAVVGGLPVLSQLALEIVRLAAYGHLLPNSVYYKVGHGGIIVVALKFVRQAWPVLSLAIVGASRRVGGCGFWQCRQSCTSWVPSAPQTRSTPQAGSSSRRGLSLRYLRGWASQR